MDAQPPTLHALPATPDALSPRQREVAALIAEGLTNAEIGERLTITPGTAANHVEHVLRRLGATGRVQVATWAIAHGLVRVELSTASDEGVGGAGQAAP